MVRSKVGLECGDPNCGSSWPPLRDCRTRRKNNETNTQYFKERSSEKQTIKPLAAWFSIAIADVCATSPQSTDASTLCAVSLTTARPSHSIDPSICQPSDPISARSTQHVHHHSQKGIRPSHFTAAFTPHTVLVRVLYLALQRPRQEHLSEP